MIAMITSLGLAGMSLFGASISGTVVDSAGQGVAGIGVFAEPGLGGKLLHTESGTGGAFQFEEVPAGATGVFIAERGQAFSGQHLNLSVGENRSGVRLSLKTPDTVSGTIKSAEGEPLKGAQITRVALLGDSKVGIPLTKLAAFGFVVPFSDEKGKFVVEGLPRGEIVALKAGHGGYAQEGVQDVQAGQNNLVIELYRGVLVEGSVTDRASQVPAANVAVLLRNAQPPHDTAVAETNAGGQFSIRLKPGVYLCGAQGVGIQSAGWEQFRVSGEEARQTIRLAVAGTGSVSGVFRDAVSTRPISGVRVSLYSGGVRSAVQRTGPAGEYRFDTAEGPSAIQIESAPGYLPPPTPQIPFVVTVGQHTELAELWLAPMPKLEIEVVGSAGTPAAGAQLQLLRPAQFGWQAANAEGKIALRLGSFPGGDKVLGFIESNPSGAASEVAIFAIAPNEAGQSAVQLYPAATVSGRVVSDAGKPLAGVEVGGLFPGESDSASPLLLWRIRTDAEGRFLWPATVPGVPQQVVARDAKGAVLTASMVNLAPDESRDLGDLKIEGGVAGPVFAGKEWSGRDFETLCGDEPDWRSLKSKIVLAVYTESQDADAIGESLDSAASLFGTLNVQPMIVTNGSIVCGGIQSPVVKAKSFDRARTVLVGPGFERVVETDGLPPFALLRWLAQP